MDEVSLFTRKPFKVVDIAQPEVFVGGLLGAGRYDGTNGKMK
jgi:hypothetical protein